MTVFAPPPSSHVRDIGQRVTRPIAILSLLVAGVMFIITPILALDWARNIPFPGALIGANLTVSDASSSDWGPTMNFDVLDHVIMIDDAPITTQRAFEQAMVDAGARADRSAHLVFQRMAALNSRMCGQTLPSGIYQCDVTRAVRTLPGDDLARLFGLPYVIGYTFLLIGVWVFRQRGNQRAGQALTFFCANAAIILALFFDETSTNALTPIYFLALGSVSGSLLGLSLAFPLAPRLIDRRPLLRFVGYLPGLALAIAAIVSLYTGSPWDYIYPVRWLFVLIGASLLFLFVTLFYRRFRSDSPIVRQQTRIILWGSLIAFLPTTLWIAQGLFNPNVPYNTLLYMPSMALFPISIAYAMLRYNQLSVDRLISGGISYVVVSLIIVIAYLASVLAMALVLHTQSTLADNPLLLVIFVLLAVIGFDVLRQRVNRTIEREFFRGRLDSQTMLRNFSRSLTEVADLPMIVNALRQQVINLYRPDRLYVFLLDARLNAFVAQPDPTMPRLPLASAQCAIDSPITRWLKAEPGPRYLQPHRALPEALLPDQTRVETIGAVLYVPLIGRDQLNGWIALGHKQNEQPYSADELSLLSSLANQTALAMERAIVFDDLQRRVNELNVLSRISQAVNFTLDTDDILELIYTQTSKVLDTRNFYIAMADPKRTTMHFAFYIEGNERLYPDDEWPIDTGLTGEIMRRGQPIVTDDYAEECHKRGLTPGGKPGKAWMGVPLNASNLPMGIMVVSDFRSDVTYSQEQLQVFAAIADQAASVLYKAKLYRETEERARQLAVLNEVGSNITSTLDLKTVLTTIVAKAIELLRAEAGSLLLVDEQRNELVFEVTFGPAASDLLGQRLPFGKGIVGAVAQTRQPQIVNEARRDSRWLRDVDQTTAFVTRAILAVPMIVKDRVIGVLELINKHEADNFTEDDQKLLTAFATNAAVAVDNARLFTMTDQALASRLDELSTLQEIDRQLNTSLDIKRVLDLTLDWGLRVTAANAGSVGIVDREQNALLLLASRNYAYQPTSLPLDKGLAGHVIRTGQPVLLNDVRQDSRYIAASPTTQSQLSVPIKRENTVVGVMNLESNRLNAFGILQLDTATRLADHAASAITNAQLYQEVTRANDAKSEFVSIVSHELKTPMTSMKGYTDLLVKGMAGPVNDIQAQFLTVIRSNVDRMSTLVNDLLEISRIETGRLKLDIKPVELDVVIDETLRTTKAQIEERQQILDLHVPEDLPLVMGDKARLIQILTNLISNAYKYTPGGGRITIAVNRQREMQPPSTLAMWKPMQSDGNLSINLAGYLVCAVQDTGVGISPEDQQKLFTKFFRSGDPAVRDVPGTGLGLSITRSLVEMQGGAIWAESEVGRGSTFSFSVPVASDGDTVQR